MKVSEVMTCGVEKISQEETLDQAAKLMRFHNVGILPVVDGGAVVGVLTDRDIVTRAVAQDLRPGKTKVSDIMTPDVVLCYADQSIADASQLMETHLIHRVIVLDRNEELAGIVSLSDIAAKAKDEKLSGHVLGQVEPA